MNYNRSCVKLRLKNSMKNWVLKLRIFFWALVLGSALFFFWTGLGLSGQANHSTNFKDNAGGMIGNLTPRDRLERNKNEEIRVIGNPVYFNLRTPREYDQANLRLEYKNQGNEKIEMGVLVDEKIWRHELKPLENKTLNKLSGSWHSTREGETLLLQKEKKYHSVQNFLNNLPEKNKIALYNYNLETDFVLDNYEATTTVQKIDTPLRGDFQIFTYLRDEDLNFSFDFEDLNQNTDSDELDLNLFYRGELIARRHLDDDGNKKDNYKVGDPGQVELTEAGLPEGLYKIELRANDDIITKKIETSQKLLSFSHKLRLKESNGSEIKIYTDSSEIQAKVINPASLQEIGLKNITVGTSEEKFKITETYKQFSQELKPGIYELNLEKGGIILTGDGVFSFSREAFLNPAYKKVKPGLEEKGVKYILANYKKPKKNEEWKRAEVSFDLDRAYREGDKYGFILSIPGLKAEEATGESLIIKDLEINLQGKNFIEKLKDFF